MNSNSSRAHPRNLATRASVSGITLSSGARSCNVAAASGRLSASATRCGTTTRTIPTFVEDVAILATGPEHDERSRRNLQPTEDLWGETNDVYQRIRIDRRPVGNQSVQAKPCDLDVSQVEKAEANANGAGAQLGGFRVPAREQVAETIDIVEFKQFEVRSHGMVTQQKPLRSTYQAQLSMDKAPDNIL